MKDYVAKNQLESKVTIIHNRKRFGDLANHVNVIRNLPDHKIVVCCDGDDELPGTDVLLRLEQEYKDPDIWMTYGSGWILPRNKPLVSEPIPPHYFFTKNKKFRQRVWVAKALRTFKAGLFKKINDRDLRYEGKYYTMSWDLAFMFPLLEMCAPKFLGAKVHYSYIPDVLLYTT